MEITNKRIIRTTNILALVLSVSVTVLLPLGYFVLSYQYQAAVLETEAEAGAYFINRLINTNPDFWRYSQHRLEGALSYHLSKEYEEAKRIVGLDNKLIASNQVSVPAPVMTRSHDLFDSGAVAARLEISSSIRPLLKNTALFGALGFFLGSVGFISFKMFPSRALSGTLKLLSESEEKFRAITTTAVDGIIVMDNKGSITYWNPAAERMFGYSQAEAVGRELHIFLAPRKYHEMYKKGFNGFRATGQGPAIGKTLEFIAVKKDGTEFPIEVSTSTISIKGEWHAVGLVHDITQRKNAERDLAEMYEAKRDEAEISASLLQFVETLSTSLEKKELVRNILDLAPGYLKFNRMSLYFYDDEAKCFAFAGAYGLSPAGKEMLGAKKIKPGDFPAIDIIMKGQAVIIDKAEEYFLVSGEMIDTFNKNSGLLVPISFRGKTSGMICGINTSGQPAAQKDSALLKGLADGLGIALQNSRLYKDLEHLLINTISSLAYAIDAKSPWTKGHSERVTGFAVEIAREMGMKEKDVNHIKLCGILHDIGKIGTFDGLLDKPGKLTVEEYELVKKHPEKGVEIIAPIKQLNDVIPGVLHHHERYDGKGYPMGLRGGDIPLCASILAVADSFDSMTADRPYRSSPGVEYAISELKRCSGSQFDPGVVEVFLKVLERSDVTDKISA